MISGTDSALDVFTCWDWTAVTSTPTFGAKAVTNIIRVQID